MTTVEKSKIHVIHYSSNDDLPQSVRTKVPDAVGQTLLRQTLNNHLAQGKSEMHSYVKGYRALQDAGYSQDDGGIWNENTGAIGGINTEGMTVDKGGPGSGPHASLKGLQEIHDALKEHSARTDEATPESIRNYTEHVEMLGKDIEAFGNKNAGVLSNARRLMTSQVQNGHELMAQSNKFKGKEKMWRVDTALSSYHTALLAAGKALGSKWVGKSTPTLQQTHVNRPMGSIAYTQDDLKKQGLMYHGTPENNVASILSNGLEPRIGENTTEHHGEIHGNRIPKVHLFDNREAAEQYGTVLTVDTDHELLKEHKFHKDPEEENAFYTADEIPAECISKGGPGSGPHPGRGGAGLISPNGKNIPTDFQSHNELANKLGFQNAAHAIKEGYVRWYSDGPSLNVSYNRDNSKATDNAKGLIKDIGVEHEEIHVDASDRSSLGGKSIPKGELPISSETFYGPAYAISHINDMIHTTSKSDAEDNVELDDPGTQDIDPPEIHYFADTPTIQNPSDGRNQNTGADHITASVPADDVIEDKFKNKEDDPGTQDVDPDNPNYAMVPNYLMMKVSKTISGSSPIKLNAKGVTLAKRLGQRIAAKGCLDILYSSPLNRGKETAEEVLEACPNTTYAKPTEELQPWHLGGYEGQEPEDVKDQIEFFIEHPDSRPTGKGADGKPAETFNEAKKRQLDFWKSVYQDCEDDPTLKIGVVCHSRGLELLQAWNDAGCPEDYKLDEKDLIHPDDAAHVSMMRWHKDKIKEIDLDDDDPLKPGVYPILHSLTDDDSDDGNEQLEKKISKYLPPIEVHRAAKLAYDAGIAVLDITAPLAEHTGLSELQVREIAKHFDAIESATESELSSNAWGGSYYAKRWASRVIKKVDAEIAAKYPPWTGVDFDGTLVESLATYNPMGIGKPIKAMCDKVKELLAAGKTVKIFTARVADDPKGKAKDLIEQFCKEHFGKVLPVTNEKDPGMVALYDDRAHNPIKKDDHTDSTYIFFKLDQQVATQLKVKDGEDPAEMHVTLLYLGKTVPVEKMNLLEKTIEVFATKYAPLEGDISGPIRFSSSVHSEGKDVCVASFDSKSIQDFRKALLTCVEKAGFTVSKDFGYTPHVTLKYIEQNENLPVQRISPIPVMFDKIYVGRGSANRIFELSGTEVAKQDVSYFGTIIEAQYMDDTTMWAHVSCTDGNRYGIFFDPKGNSIQIGDLINWNGVMCYWTPVTQAGAKDVPLPKIGITQVTKASDGVTWVTINGQRIPIGADGKPVGGNPRAFGRNVSSKVDRARQSAVLCGKHEQDIADKSEAKLSKALGIPRTKNNSAFDLRSDDIGIEVKTMITGHNDKITMSKTALGRKMAEAHAEELKTFTVVADMRGRSAAKYYVSEKLGSIRLGSMTPVSLDQLKEMVKL